MRGHDELTLRRIQREAREAEALRVLTIGLAVRIAEEARRTEEYLRRIRAGYAAYGEARSDDRPR